MTVFDKKIVAKFLGQKRLEMGPSFMRNSLQNFYGFLHKVSIVKSIESFSNIFPFFQKKIFFGIFKVKRGPQSTQNEVFQVL